MNDANLTKMEDYIELKCYIKYNLYYGHTFDEIKNALIKNNWPEDLIDKAYEDVKKSNNIIPNPKIVGKFVKT